MLLNRRTLFNREPSFATASNDALRAMANSISIEDGPDRRRRLFDLLDETHKFSAPKGKTDRELSAIWRQLKAEQRAGIVDPEDVGKTDDQLKAEYRAIAERRVRLGLVLK